MVSGISSALAIRFVVALFLLRCQNRPPGNFGLGAVRSAREFFNRTAIQIASWKIHRGKVSAGRKGIIHETHPLEQFRPVSVGDCAHTGDDVAYGDGSRSLPLMLL